jgi:hypothetical protein
VDDLDLEPGMRPPWYRACVLSCIGPGVSEVDLSAWREIGGSMTDPRPARPNLPPPVPGNLEP